MIPSDVRQLELFSDMDALRERIQRWIAHPSVWEPIKPCQLLLKRISDRVETLQIRMESPLVVATFGGTGTGKSTLVNALVGSDVTRTGRQRPTTTLPVLIAHPQTSLTDLGLPVDDLEVVRCESDLLRDVVLLDCPDPDTNEDESGNVERLRKILPFCDVLIYVSTQQKYKSARVSEELKSAAAGCRIIFVQTHADLDSDIRNDWIETLSTLYDVPDVFLVDSLKGLRDQQQGKYPTGDLGRLMELLRNKFVASERVRIRRANVLEDFHEGLKRCQETLGDKQAALEDLKKLLASQDRHLRQRMSVQLHDELLSNRSLWEKRLLSRVIDQWGMSPFSGVLRLYHGLGNLIASSMLFRVRSAAQLAILGTVQGVRWAERRNKEHAAESTLHRLSHTAVDDSILRETEIVIRGQVSAAALSPDLMTIRSISDLRNHAADVEQELMGDVSRRIDLIIQEQAAENSHQGRRLIYEIIISLYLAFILWRVGKNFFYDSLFDSKALLTTDFYIAASLFLVLICGVLLYRFNSQLQNGLTGRIRQMTDQMANARLSHGLFPELERGISDAENSLKELNALLAETKRLRSVLNQFSDLGGKQSKLI